MRILVDVEAMRATRTLLTLAAAFPKETRRALGRYGGLLRRRMVRGVKTSAGVPLSAIRNVLRTGKAGGATAESKTIKVARPSRFQIVVDWIEPLRPYASRWQTGGPVNFDRVEVRHYMHAILGKRGARDLPLDPAATQPERPVSAPVREEAAREAPRVILGMTRTILQRAAK